MCVVAGPLGVAGSALMQELEKQRNCEVVGVSRRPSVEPERRRHISVDLTESEDCARAVAGLVDTTHIYFSAYAPRSTLGGEVVPNLSMLVNLVTALERVAPRLRHVTIIQGSKWYGNHLGAYKTPAREDDPRHMPPNFYYNQQDWIEEYQRGKSWTWTAWRPHGLCGISVGSAMNQLNALAVYATVSRELGLPLRFPGNPAAYGSLYQFTDASLLARAALWGANEPACENRSFNITNGDPERWENIWDAIAVEFQMEAGPVQTIRLTDFMADKEPVWAKICERHGLRQYRLSDLVNWHFADWVYSTGFDQLSSLVKVREAGWHETVRPVIMFRQLFGALRKARIIP